MVIMKRQRKSQVRAPMTSVNRFVEKEGLNFPPKTVVPFIKCNYNYPKSLKTPDISTKKLLECDAVLH